MALYVDATEEDFITSMVLHPREISEECLRQFEGYMAEVFQTFGMDMTDPGHRPHPALLHPRATGCHRWLRN